MKANDATLTELATVHTGSRVENNAPNAPSDATFDLVIEAAAGNTVGNSGAHTLTISVIDLTAVGQPWPPRSSPKPSTRPPGGNLAAPAPITSTPRPSRSPSPAAVPAAPGRPHPAIRGIPRQPGRPNRLDHPRRPLRARLTPSTRPPADVPQVVRPRQRNSATCVTARTIPTPLRHAAGGLAPALSPPTAVRRAPCPR
jgi:hypothetical protein